MQSNIYHQYALKFQNGWGSKWNTRYNGFIYLQANTRIQITIEHNSEPGFGLSFIENNEINIQDEDYRLVKELSTTILEEMTIRQLKILQTHISDLIAEN